MNVKVKTTLIILTTFVIGVALGALLNRALLHRRIERAFAWRNPSALSGMIESIVSPDTEPSAEIEKILKDHAATMSRIRENSFAEMEEAVRALDEALTPLLTPEQKERFRRKPIGPFGFRPPGRDPRRGGLGGPAGSPDLWYWTDQLDLTEEQVNRLRELLPGPTMPPGMGSQDMQGMERMLHMWKNLQQDLDKALAEILTEDQKAEYERLKQEQRDRLAEILLEK